jgi:holo-[acyl-carrier-protein] synthase
MILGIGTDLVDCRRVSRLLASHPHAAIKKVMRPSEVQFYKGDIYIGFSKTWAYKEATIKAANGVIGFSDIEIFHLESGNPRVRIFNEDAIRTYAAAVLGKSAKDGQFAYHATLTDEFPYVSSVCVIEMC